MPEGRSEGWAGARRNIGDFDFVEAVKSTVTGDRIAR